jgi:hypothetical protein
LEQGCGMENIIYKPIKLSTMRTSITKKQQMRNEIDMLIKNNKFITWDMLEVSPYTYNNKYLTYEGKIVFEYMKELNCNYVRYEDKFSNRIMKGNTKGFYNDIAVRRKHKLQYIESLNRL